MLTNDIFHQEMLHVYEQKSQSRDELVAEARCAMLELADEMKRGVCEHPEAEQMLLSLSRELKNAKGKKQYGYLSKSVKKQVDEIVDQLVRLPSVQKCYEKWLELQHEVNEFYSDKPIERVPLSQQKEFLAIHNAVIQAALRLEQFTFEDRNMARYDEPDDILQGSEICGRIWSVVCDDSLPLDMRDEGVERLHTQAEDGKPYAQLLLGKLYWEGEDILQDMGKAVYWLTQAAEQGHVYAQILVERQDSPSLPPAILAVNSLLHSIGRIFQDNTRVIDGTHGQHTDRKLRRKIQKKKIAMGHKPDDHEEQRWGSMTM